MSSPPEPALRFRDRIVSVWNWRLILIRHHFRTSYRYRNTVFAGSVALLVALGAALLFLRSTIDAVSGTAVAAVVLAAVVIRTVLLAPALPPHAHGLDGVHPPQSCEPVPQDRTALLWAARGLALLSAVLVVIVPGRWALAAAAAAAFVAVPVARDKAAVVRARRTIRAALAQFDPRWALTYGGLAGGPTHLSMWIPYLQASGDSGVLINLRARYCADLRVAAALPLPWVQLGSDTLGDLRVISVRSIRSYFHVHNAPIHLRLFGVRWVTHVWLGHGDSDKPGSRHERHKNFDLLVVSGQAAIDRYTTHGVDIPRERFRILGRPQVGDIERAAAPITSIQRPRVLYAPTWTGRRETLNFSSITLGPRIVRALIDAGTDVVFRPHPVFLRVNKSTLLDPIHRILQDDTDDPDTAGHHVWGDVPNVQWSVFDCMNNSDALLSDVSSVVSDWLQSTKPYAMMSMKHEVEDFVTAIPVAQAGYVIAQDLSNLGTELTAMLDSDPLAQARARLKVHVLGPYDGHESAEAFAAFVRDLGRTSKPVRP